jgi:hypothetical protein
MAGEYDPITPPAWGQRAAQTLTRSYFFEYPGVGHGASVVSGCPQDMMIAFLGDPGRAPDDACMAEMSPPRFVVSGAGVGPVEMQPFTNEQMGIRGLAPAGWSQASPGTYVRGSSALDSTALIQQALPLSAKILLDLLVAQLGPDETPPGVGERQANGLNWALYNLEVEGVSVDIALAEGDGLALLVMMQSEPDEREALYEAVFLPAVDALALIE